MNKSLKVLFTLTAVGILAGCNTGVTNVEQNHANVFPYSTVGEEGEVMMGDVMPFYDGEQMNIYHLRDVTDTNSKFYHPIARLSTKDLIHYEDKGIALNYETSAASMDAALGTGSFVKDENGLYHAFYTGHSGDFAAAGFPHMEALRHATSPDQNTWTKDENFLKFGDHDDYRDPYVYKAEDGFYYMLVTTHDYNKRVIRRYKTSTLKANMVASDWEDVGNFYVNNDGDYNMECPSFVKVGEYYYLAFSEQTDNNPVTHYVYSKDPNGNFQSFARNQIDSLGFYAGRLEKGQDDKLYAFAWCAVLKGGSTGQFGWAGNLVTHEIVQDPLTGELHAVIPENYKNYFSHQMPSLDINDQIVTSFTSDGKQFDGITLRKSETNVTRLSMKAKVNELKKGFGLSFGLDGDYNRRLGSGIVNFELENNKIVCYNSVSSILRYGTPLTSTDFTFQAGETYDIDVIMDGEVISVYMNKECALTIRIVDNRDSSNYVIYSNGANVEVSEVARYE